jgi:hypothetical protein
MTSKEHITHLFAICIEKLGLKTFRVAHLLENGCLACVGVTDDQDPKALDILPLSEVWEVLCTHAARSW